MKVLFFDEFQELLRRKRPAVEVPLHGIAAVHLQKLDLLFGFDAFSNCHLTHLMRHFYDGAADHFGIISAANQVYERLVDLDQVER